MLKLKKKNSSINHEDILNKIVNQAIKEMSKRMDAELMALMIKREDRNDKS